MRLMTERELRIWMRYAGAKGLPLRRVEFGLALLALKTVQVNGDAESTLTDFLFDKKPEQPQMTADEGAMAMNTMAGGKGVRRLGRKKGGA